MPGGELVKSKKVQTDKDPVWNLIYNVRVITESRDDLANEGGSL